MSFGMLRRDDGWIFNDTSKGRSELLLDPDNEGSVLLRTSVTIYLSEWNDI